MIRPNETVPKPEVDGTMLAFVPCSTRVWLITLIVSAVSACSAAPGPRRITQGPVYESGLQIFPSPRTFDAPGTIFRVDPDGIRRNIVDLSGMLKIIPKEEAVPQLAVSGTFSVAAILSWLGASVGSAELERIDSALVYVGGAKREGTTEVSLRPVVDSAAKLIDWTKPGRVYLITETVLADTVKISLSRCNAPPSVTP